MYNKMDLSRCNYLLSKDEFLKKILNSNSNDEIKEIFKKENVEINNEEIEFLCTNIVYAIQSIQANSDKEISDNELIKINGGKSIMEYDENSKYNSILEKICNLVPEVKDGKKTGKSYWYPSVLKVASKALCVSGLMFALKTMKTADIKSFGFWSSLASCLGSVISFVS